RFGGPLHVDFGREEIVGDRAEGRDQALRDRLADLRQRDVFVRTLGRRETGTGKGLSSRGRRRRCGSDRRRPFEVPLYHAPAGSRPLKVLQVDGGLVSNAPRQRGPLHSSYLTSSG